MYIFDNMYNPGSITQAIYKATRSSTKDPNPPLSRKSHLDRIDIEQRCLAVAHLFS
jgi:hypothetical protein